MSVGTLSAVGLSRLKTHADGISRQHMSLVQCCVPGGEVRDGFSTRYFSGRVWNQQAPYEAALIALAAVAQAVARVTNAERSQSLRSS